MFQEHFTAEPVRDEILEETTSFQEVMTTPAINPQEEWRDLEIVEEDLVSAASSTENRPSRRGSRMNRSATSSEETISTNSSDRRSGRIKKQVHRFDVDKYAKGKSVQIPKSRSGPISLRSTKSAQKDVVQTAWRNRPSRTPGLMRRDRTVSGERERTGSLKSRRSLVETDSATDAEAERIWQNTTEDDEDNRSIVTRAASLERIETGSRTGSILGSTLNNSREGGEVNFVGNKKCVLRVSESCEIKPREGKWIYVNYDSKMSEKGEYLQPCLLNTIVERNLYESKFSPRAGNKKIPAIYIINTNDFFVQLKRGETLGTLVRLRANQEDGQGREGVLTGCRDCRSCSSTSPLS